MPGGSLLMHSRFGPSVRRPV